MNGLPAVTKVVAGKQYLLLKRYLFNTLSEILMMYVFFAVIFFGGNAVAPEFISDSLSGIIVAFFLLTMASVAYSDLSWDIIHEAQWGTLEQLYMSAQGFGRVVVVKTVVNVLFSFVFGAAVLVLMMVTTGRYLSLDVVTVVPLVLLSLASAVGVGFVLGGLAVVYKRVESTFQIVQFAFVGFVVAPVDPWVLKLLPLTLGSHLLRLAMGEGQGLAELPVVDLGLLVVKAILYLVVGYLAFRFAERTARKRGVMGHY